MRVKFRTSLGSQDAPKYGLDWSKCRAHDEVDVETEIGEALIQNGFVEAIVKAPEKPVDIKGVPSVQKATSDLKSYRAKQLAKE